MTKKIEELREELVRLEIRQETLRRDTRVPRTNLDRLTTTDEKTEEEITPGTGLRHGDKITIINPSKGQDKEGILCGKTKDNLIKLKPSKGKVIRRLPKNLLLQK